MDVALGLTHQKGRSKSDTRMESEPTGRYAGTSVDDSLMEVDTERGKHTGMFLRYRCTTATVPSLLCQPHFSGDRRYI